MLKYTHFCSAGPALVSISSSPAALGLGRSWAGNTPAAACASHSFFRRQSGASLGRSEVHCCPAASAKAASPAKGCGCNPSALAGTRWRRTFRPGTAVLSGPRRRICFCRRSMRRYIDTLSRKQSGGMSTYALFKRRHFVGSQPRTFLHSIMMINFQ